MVTDAGARLSAELEAALVRALARDFENLNYSHFRRRLRQPILLLGDRRDRLGLWSPVDRTLEISRRLVLEHPWGVVVEVLKHEMAHQFVHEVLGRHDEAAHGPAFRELCESLGIDARASGLPRHAAAPTEEERRSLERIRKLLALAASDNPHESAAAMAEAQRLMLHHNLDGAPTAPGRGYSFRHLGEATGRLQAHQRLLASILGRHFFVEPIWVTVHRPEVGKPGTVLEICGRDDNLEMASYVHDFLIRAAEAAWRQHQRQLGITADANRRSFLCGVMRGFDDKLGEQRREQQAAGLVLRRDLELRTYFAQRYPRTRTVRPAGRADPGAFREGQRAGREITIHQPVKGRPAVGPRLLPGRGGG